MMRWAPFAAFLLASCAASQPAPISYGGGAARAERAQSPQPRVERRDDGRGPVIEYRGAGAPSQPQPSPGVFEQEELPAPAPARVEAPPDWAEGDGTPLSAYALQPDDAQPYDPARLPRTHRVGRNESLYDIATRYQVPLRALIDQNRLEPPYALAEGRELELPPPRFHTVARGETLGDVARRYNVDRRSLALLNRLEPPYQVSQGDRIVLPALARELTASVQTPAATPPSTQQAPPVIRSADARFAMPLNGAIVARFGAQPGGVRVDGVEIAGQAGDAVTAAADGDVVYAGDDLPAYGVLILIRHADNYVTAYGFNRRALVREGQRVRAGDRIAELGVRADGGARLLFQVRQGSAVVDPAPLLGVSN